MLYAVGPDRLTMLSMRCRGTSPTRTAAACHWTYEMLACRGFTVNTPRRLQLGCHRDPLVVRSGAPAEAPDLTRRLGMRQRKFTEIAVLRWAHWSRTGPLMTCALLLSVPRPSPSRNWCGSLQPRLHRSTVQPPARRLGSVPRQLLTNAISFLASQGSPLSPSYPTSVESLQPALPAALVIQP